MNEKKVLSMQKALVASNAWDGEAIGRIGTAVDPKGRMEIHITDVMDMGQDNGYVTEKTYPNSGLFHQNEIGITMSIYSRHLPPIYFETDIIE